MPCLKVPAPQANRVAARLCPPLEESVAEAVECGHGFWREGLFHGDKRIKVILRGFCGEFSVFSAQVFSRDPGWG